MSRQAKLVKETARRREHAPHWREKARKFTRKILNFFVATFRKGSYIFRANGKPCPKFGTNRILNRPENLTFQNFFYSHVFNGAYNGWDAEWARAFVNLCRYRTFFYKVTAIMAHVFKDRSQNKVPITLELFLVRIYFLYT